MQLPSDDNPTSPNTSPVPQNARVQDVEGTVGRDYYYNEARRLMEEDNLKKQKAFIDWTNAQREKAKASGLVRHCHHCNEDDHVQEDCEKWAAALTAKYRAKQPDPSNPYMKSSVFPSYAATRQAELKNAGLKTDVAVSSETAPVTALDLVVEHDLNGPDEQTSLSDKIAKAVSDAVLPIIEDKEPTMLKLNLTLIIKAAPHPRQIYQMLGYY